MKAILRSGFLALAIMALTVPANAGPFEDALAAAQRGDYVTALRLLRPLAEQGHAGAPRKVCRTMRSSLLMSITTMSQGAIHPASNIEICWGSDFAHL